MRQLGYWNIAEYRISFKKAETCMDMFSAGGAEMLANEELTSFEDIDEFLSLLPYYSNLSIVSGILMT